MHADRLLTHTLRASPHGRALAEVMAAALAAADPAAAVRARLRREGATVEVDGRRYQGVARVLVVAAGKAAAPMLHAARATLGDLPAAGVLVTKDGHIGSQEPSAQRPEAAGAHNQAADAQFALLAAGHPLPDARGVAAAERIAALLSGARPDDLVLVLLSGGGSALLTWPAPGLALADLQAMTGALLRCGAPIGQINTLRKHTTRLFGGQLARMAAPAPVAALVISDVIGSPLDVIASGPTTADPSTFADAWAVVERYGLAGELPAALVSHLQLGLAGALPDTPKPADTLWQRVHSCVVASNVHAAEAAVAAARARGWNALLLTTYLEGEAREVGRVAAGLARELALRCAPIAHPALLVLGGETTVTIRGEGLGGRNQELALGAAEGLAGLPATLLVALATDGGDGPTDAAGAVASGETLSRAQALGLAPTEFLRRNDAYRFFEPLGDLLRPGPTQTNVNDLLFVAALPG